MTGERALTARLGRWFGSGPGVLVPIGDDAAVVAASRLPAVLCCDPVVEGVHFTSGEDLRRVGRKAVNRNLSDLAAMGAVPAWLLVSLVLPRGLDRARLHRLLLGIRSAARAGGAVVVGGDVAASPGPLVVTVTAIGHLHGAALRRDGARAGDAIHLSGPVGGSAEGHHLDFRPHLREGRWLARHAGRITAAIDVSDGVLLDLEAVLQASGGLGAELFADAIPLRAAALRGARGRRAAALGPALRAGEDHVLLFTVAAGGTLPRGGPLTARARRPVGRVLPRPGLWLCEASGRRRLAARGYEHDVPS